MNFDLTGDQKEIRGLARDVFAARYPLAGARERGAADGSWNEMVELGLAAPFEMELGHVELSLVAEELGYALAPSSLASAWAATLLGLPGGDAAGARAAVAFWDEGSAGDPTASALGAGADGTLTGVKVAVPDAETADTIVVVGAADGALAAWSVERGATGVTVEPVDSLDTARPLSTVRLDGAPATPLEVPPHALDALCMVTAAEAVGTAARAMEMAVEYAKERKQFGRAIGTYQAVSHPCAQMLLDVEGARALVRWAAWALDHDPDAVPRAAASAKAHAADAATSVCRSSLQVHGGIGFTWEHDLHLLLKRAETLAPMFGTAAWHRERLATLVLTA